MKLKIRDIITNEDQSGPIKNETFRQHLKENFGIEFTKDHPDINLIHSQKVEDHNPSDDRPIIILERIDSSCIRNRHDLIENKKVCGIIKNNVLHPNSLNNTETFQGRYHCKLIKDSCMEFKDDPLDSIKGIIEPKKFNKIKIGWNFAIYDRMVPFKNNKLLLNNHRTIDVHFAGTMKYGRVTSINYHRKRCFDEIFNMKNIVKDLATSRVYSKEQYINILNNTKIIVSPWGFGEACYRDFEAMYCGCVLIKPDTSFVDTFPNIYQNNKTYVPCNYNFSDLQEKIKMVLDNWEKYEQMRNDNYQLLLNSWNLDVRCKRFSDIISGFIK